LGKFHSLLLSSKLTEENFLMKNPHRETLDGFPALERDGARAHGYTNTLALRRFHHGRRRLTENDEENDDEEATGCQSGKSKGPRGRAMATQHVRALLSLSLCLLLAFFPLTLSLYG